MSGKLKEGQEVLVNVPFRFTIGDEGYWSGKKLETIEDCENEVREEIREVAEHSQEMLLESKVL